MKVLLAQEIQISSTQIQIGKTHHFELACAVDSGIMYLNSQVSLMLQLDPKKPLLCIYRFRRQIRPPCATLPCPLVLRDMTDTGFLSSLFIEAMAYSLISYVALGLGSQNKHLQKTRCYGRKTKRCRRLSF